MVCFLVVCWGHGIAVFGSNRTYAGQERHLLARGNINFIRYELNELLQLFRINLDPNCQDYRKVAIAVIKAEVRALEDVRARNRGEAIDSPKLIEPSSEVPVSSCSLRAAYEGWDKMEQRPTSTRMEFSRGIDRFIELHGDLDVRQINKRHVREFREAAQLVPKHRPGKLRKARLPELVEWTRKNPGTVCIAAATINKWLTCLQGVLNWARRNGVIPDEVPWADPVAGMRLKEPRSKRRPWEPEELSLLFGSSIYHLGERPLGGKGEAAYWLPLLALFSGARLNELAPMCANDVKLDPSSGAQFMTVIEDDKTGRSVKTENSVRAVPIHPELLRIGFLTFVDHRRKADGQKARLFPEIQQNSKGNYGAAFSQWFGRHKRSLGIDNASSVFHSFRHGFKDALRAAGVNEDVNDALTGHSGGNPVARGYGSDDMVRRFGFSALNAAVEKAQYLGLDLSQLRWTPPTKKRNGCHLWKKKAAHGLLMGSLCAANVCLRPTPLSRGSFWLLCPSLLRISLSLPQAPWWPDVQHHEGRLSGLSYRLVSVPTSLDQRQGRLSGAHAAPE
jgi:integrase